MSNLPKSFFELIEASDKPVLVDFYADWCGPCKMVSPAIKRVAGDFKGRIITIKINVDHKQQIAARYQIQSIPTIMMFYKGRDIMRLTGAYPYEAIKAEVEKVLDPSDSNMDSWLNSLSERDRLRVFQMLSSYLSGTELKKVMERVKKGSLCWKYTERWGF